MATKLTDVDFDSVIQGADLALVDFWADWCQPCKMLSPVLEEVEKGMAGKVSFYKLNVDENPKTSAKYDVESIPTLILFKKGKPLTSFIGFRPKGVLEKELASALK